MFVEKGNLYDIREGNLSSFKITQKKKILNHALKTCVCVRVC